MRAVGQVLRMSELNFVCWEELTIVHENIVKNGDQVWHKALILQMLYERDDILSLDDSSSIRICVSTRVSSNSQSLDLHAVTLLFLRSKDIQEELEDA